MQIPAFPRLALLSVLLLSACGDDAAQPTELNGVLHAGQIQGVEFATATRQGVTDVSGRFAYLPGETVRFSVGGIALGSAAGAPEITLFTLAGLTPPTTERALRRELDLAMRTHSPFTRAMNMDLLLIELDADGNPDNGMDVRNRQATLAGIALDFDLTYLAFETSLYRFVPDLTHNIPPMLPVVHLYGTLGIKVPVHAETRVEYGGQFSGVTTMNHYRYHANGAIAADELDLGGDGVAESRVSFEYGALARSLRTSYEEDTDLDQVMDRTSSTAREYDQHGNLVGATDHYYPRPGEIAVQRLLEIEYDRFGRPRRQVIVTDEGDDGTIDSRQVHIGEYDARGNGVSSRWRNDSNADGVDDSSSLTTFKYDARDRLQLQTEEFDANADGVVDWRSVSNREYAGDGGPVRQVIETDDDADGIADSREIFQWSYDRAGNATWSSYENQPLADGIANYKSSATREFDRDRRVTRMVRSDDYDGAGSQAQFQTDSYIYDATGNLNEYVSEYDDAADGVVDSRVTQRSEHGHGGELLATGSSYDWDADGLSDSYSTQIVSHTLMEDGVLHLAQWYFMRRSYVDGAVATSP